jgi:hypothetical protein
METKYVEILNKNTRQIDSIPLDDFIDHKSDSYSNEAIKPKTITQSYRILLSLIKGQIWQTLDHCVRLKYLPTYEWDWSK